MRFFLQRVFQAVIVVLATSIIVFAAVFAIGDPMAVLVNPSTPPDVMARTAKELGLDQPLHIQYWLFLKNALKGELGTSYVFAEPTLKLILARFPATLELVVAAMLIAILVGMPLGILGGYSKRRGTKLVISNLSIAGVSIPHFWLGLMLIMVFAVQYQLLPSGGRGTQGTLFGWQSGFFSLDGLRHLALPALTLSTFPMCVVMRMTETSLEETLRLDHVRFARALGIPPRWIVIRYALRSMLVPIVTIMGIIFSTLVAFSVVTETVFAWPGIGKLIMESIRSADRPVVVAYILFVVILVTVTNAIVDVLCSAIDPRIRLSGAEE
jgi:peptide/nickel transport system permease protein